MTMGGGAAEPAGKASQQAAGGAEAAEAAGREQPLPRPLREVLGVGLPSFEAAAAEQAPSVEGLQPVGVGEEATREALQQLAASPLAAEEPLQPGSTPSAAEEEQPYIMGPAPQGSQPASPRAPSDDGGAAQSTAALPLLPAGPFGQEQDISVFRCGWVGR